MKTTTPEITNKLAAVRKRRGLSASALAALVGVSRQTIYAIEAGAYVPNTAIALRLAQALGTAIEDLFCLLEELVAPASRFKKAKLLPLSDTLVPGQPVQLCKVGGKLVAAASSPWYLPLADGTIGGAGQVDVYQPEEDMEQRVLLAGCDPAMGIVARYLRSSRVELVLLQQNSSQSLSLLKSGFAHIAGSHQSSNVSAVNKLFPGGAAAIISFAVWQEGLVTASGNPKRIKGVEDLARKDVNLVNREAGSGSRTLLDRHRTKLGMDADKITGYLRTVPGHLAATWAVKIGDADCCIATEAAARFFGLNFIPLETVHYDWAVTKKQLATPCVQLLLDAINHLAFRQKLKNVGGYDTSITGTRIQ